MVCCSAFDIALHDAFGVLRLPTYRTYTSQFMNRDLAAYLTPAEGADASFAGRYRPTTSPPTRRSACRPGTSSAAWTLDRDELTGKEPRDGYPVLLGDWIQRDGPRC